jgi:glycosyltransferase involved in cell wall biosynthesis
MPARRSLLYLASEYPVPVSSAGRLRTFNWILHLSRRFDLTLLAPAWQTLTDTDRDALEARCVHVITPSPGRDRSLPQRLWTRLAADLTYLRSGRPRLHYRVNHGNVRAAAQRLIDSRRFDVAFAEHWAWGKSLLQAAPCTVLDLGGLQSTTHAAVLAHSRNPLLRLQRRRLQNLYHRAETEVVARTTLVIVQNAVAKREVERIAGACTRVFVVPVGLDTAYFAAERRHAHSRNVLFFSSLKGPAERDALQYLHRTLMPEIREQFGQVRLTIVASEPVPELADVLRTDPTVRFTGPLDDPRPELARATVAVLPMRFGPGAAGPLSQLLSMGIPAVATPVATRGLDIASGDGVLVATGTSEITAAVSQVLQDESLRGDLSLRARETAEARLSMQATYGRLADILDCAGDMFSTRSSL